MTFVLILLAAAVALALVLSGPIVGALGGDVVFLVWLWITNMAILLGAEFNAETERARQIKTGVAGAAALAHRLLRSAGSDTA